MASICLKYKNKDVQCHEQLFLNIKIYNSAKGFTWTGGKKEEI